MFRFFINLLFELKHYKLFTNEKYKNRFFNLHLAIFQKVNRKWTLNKLVSKIEFFLVFKVKLCTLFARKTKILFKVKSLKVSFTNKNLMLKIIKIEWESGQTGFCFLHKFYFLAYWS